MIVSQSSAGLVRPTAAGQMVARQVGFGWRFVAPLFVGGMLNPINSTMIAVALIPIGHSYRVGLASTAWLVAALYLACAIAQPLMGQLADRLGARRVELAGLALVGMAGPAGALAPSLGMLVGVRVLVGIGTSAAYPAAMSIVRAQSMPSGARLREECWARCRWRA